MVVAGSIVYAFIGTFQVFILLPQGAFTGGNPLLPTLEGQYAVKNLVLITAGLVISSTVRKSKTHSSMIE